MSDEQKRRRESFIKTFETAATFEEWVKSYFSSKGQLLWVASFADLSDREIHEGQEEPLEYHWQYREVYAEFPSDVWASAGALAKDYGFESVLKMMVELGDDVKINSQERFTNRVVLRAISKVAADIEGV